MSRFALSAPREAAACAAVALASLLACTTAGHAATFDWRGVTGSAATASNWTPSGVPGAADLAQFGALATSTTTWPAGVDTVDRIYVTLGTVTFNIANRLRLNSVISIGNGSLSIGTGKISVNHWSCAGAGAFGVIGYGSEATATGIGVSTFGGPAAGPAFLFNVNGGCTFRSNGSISLGSGGPLTGLVSGDTPPATLTTTTVGPFDQGTITIGEYGGPAKLTFDNGGLLSAAGDLYIGRHPAGSGVLWSRATLGRSILRVDGQTFIAGNATIGETGGTGALVIGGDATLVGRCWLGDADDSPNGSVKSALQTEGQGNLVLAGGLSMSDALSAELRLIGGTTQLIAGVSSIHQAAPFVVQGYGSPALWLEGGSVTDIQNGTSGGPALGVGRSNVGAVRVAGPGTVLNVHGATAIADSMYGYATLDVDSAATLNLMGAVNVSAGGPATIHVRGPGSTATVSGSMTLGASGQNAFVLIDSLAALNLNGGLVATPASYGFIDAARGAQVAINGATFPSVGGALRARDGGAQITVTGHCDLSGRTRAECDSGGVFLYDGPINAMTLGAGCYFEVFRGGYATVNPQLDLRGILALSETVTADLIANIAPTSRVRPVHGPLRSNAAGAPDRSRLECPLVRVLEAGQILGTGTVAGRVHLDSPLATIAVPNPYSVDHGRLTLGDSTATDGFVSIGQTDIGADTLLLLDSNGPDLGRVAIDGGWLLSQGPAHLRPGDWLRGHGRIEGSLDVKSGGRLAFLGTVKGSLQLAGELGNAPTPGVLAITGALLETPSARITLKVGDGPQDLVTVGGTASLAGTLDVRIGAGALPLPGDTLTLISAGAIAGTFADVTFDGGPSAGVIQVIYGPSSVRVAVVGALTGVDDGAPGATGVSQLAFAPTGAPLDGALRLDLPAAAHARVVLFDVSGRQLAVLADADLPAGRHRLAVGRGFAPASGVYFARAAVRGEGGTRMLGTRLVVLR